MFLGLNLFSYLCEMLYTLNWCSHASHMIVYNLDDQSFVKTGHQIQKLQLKIPLIIQV